MLQFRPHYGFCAPCQFIAQHDLADGESMLRTQRQQFRGRGERVFQAGLVLDNTVCTRRCLIDDKAAAHRVIAALSEHLPAGAQGMKYQPVRVIGQRFPAVKHQLEVQRPVTEQPQLAVRMNLFEPCGYGIGIDRFGSFPFQPKDDGLVGTMALAGGTQ
jgi:hypothetical protein